MVPLVPCRSITTCASRLNYIHSCSSDLQRHCAWISAVTYHSSRRHDVNTQHNGCSPLPPIVWQYRQFVCLLSAGEPSQFPAPAHNDLPSHVTSSIVLYRHSRFSASVSKIPIFHFIPGHRHLIFIFSERELKFMSCSCSCCYISETVQDRS